MRGWLLPLLLASAFLAGCSDGGGTPTSNEVVVTSDLPEEIRSDDQPQPEPEKTRAKGHIKGYVLTDKLEPIEGAIVTLPGLDKDTETDRDGAFAFVDLHAGPHFIQFNATGFYGAAKEIDVDSGSFTEVKVLLTRIPPPTPYHTTTPFRGYADLTDSLLLSGIFCSGCQVPFYVDMQPRTLIIEAVTSSDVQFDARVNIQGDCCGSVTSGSGPNPLYLMVPGEQLPPDWTAYELEMYVSSLVPQTAVDFDFYVTAFYHQPAPDGWSFVGGDL